MVIIGIGLTMVLAVIDLAVKMYVEHHLEKHKNYDILGGKLQIRKVHNKGFAMNTMDKKPDYVCIASMAVTVMVTLYQWVILLYKKKYLKKIGLSFMAAGAWSNSFDRWTRRYVVDYIGMPLKNKKLKDLTYNLGDFYIFIGGFLIIISELFNKKHK